MKNMEFELFGSTITIHSDLVKYVDAIHKYNEKSKSAISLLDTLVSRNTEPDAICDSLWNRTCQDVQEVLVELSQYGVYNKTVSDFISKSFYDSVLHSYEDRLSRDISEADDARDHSLSVAETSTDAMVTGLPFEIFTNSIIGMGVYVAQQSSELKKQRTQANKEYFRRAESINNYYDSTVSLAKGIQYSTFHRELAKAISETYNSILSQHMIELSACNEFDLKCVDDLSIAKSCELLDNLDIMQNKEEVIKQSVLACPFNPAPFAKAGLLGMTEPTLREMAIWLHICEDIIEFIEITSGMNDVEETRPASIYAKYAPACKAISFFTGDTEEELLNRYFATLKSNTVCAYESLASKLRDNYPGLYKSSELNHSEITQEEFSRFVITQTCSQDDMTVLTHQFGMSGLEAEIACTINCPESIGVSYEAIQNYLIKQVSAVWHMQKENDKVRREQEDAIARAAEIERKAKEKKITTVATISIVSCLLLMIIGLFVIRPMAQYRKAIDLYEEKRYEDADDILSDLGSYRNSQELRADIPYRKAEDLVETGNYKDAATAFRQLGEYKDSAERAEQVSYQYADQLESQGDYFFALEVFQSISSYSDVEHRISGLENTIYNEGVAAFEQGKYEKACSYFEKLPEAYPSQGTSLNGLIEMCKTASMYIQSVETIESADKIVTSSVGFEVVAEAVEEYGELFADGAEITGVSLSEEKQLMVEMYNLYSPYAGTYFGEVSTAGHLSAEMYFSRNNAAEGYFFLKLKRNFGSSNKTYDVASISGGKLESEDGSYQLYNGTLITITDSDWTQRFTRDDFWAINK